MTQLLETVSQNFVPALIGFCFLTTILIKAVTSVIMTAAQERSRREIAAYIAEGSLTPEQGERLLKADVGHQVRA